MIDKKLKWIIAIIVIIVIILLVYYYNSSNKSSLTMYQAPQSDYASYPSIGSFSSSI